VDFRPDVEGLRAVAVVLVVLFHAGFAPLPGGFVGVDVFFVISGFLITGLIVDELLRTGTISISNFYSRRARRLLPAAGTVLVTTAVVFSFVLPAIDRPALGADVIAATLWFANWHFASASTDYFAVAAEHSPVLHFWSLSVEEQFYLFWPLLVLAVAGRGMARRGGPRPPGRLSTGALDALPSPRTVVQRVALALLPLGAISLVLSALTTASTGPWAYFGVHTRAWELAAGGAVALARGYLHRLSARGAACLGWAGLSLVVTSAVVMDGATPFPGIAAMVPVAGAAAVLAAGARTQTGVASLLSRGSLTYVGRVSYSWYLWHWPCLELARRLTVTPTLDEFAPQRTDPWALAVAVLGSFLLAIVTYRLVETPTRSWSFLARSKMRTLGFTAATVAVCVAVPWTLLSRPDTGWPPSDAVSQPLAVAGTPSPRPSSSTSRTTVRLPPQTPAQARADRLDAVGCFQASNGVEVVADCQKGDPDGEKVMVLIGDSHAAHWLPAFEILARDRGWQLWFWAKSSCAYPGVVQWLESYKREYTECQTWRQNVLARIEALPRVDALVIGRASPYLQQLGNGEGGLLEPQAAERRWEEGARETFTTLGAKAAEVVVLQDIPYPRQDIPACLSTNGADPEQCAFDVGTRKHADAAMTAAEKAAAVGTRVRFVDTTRVVCPQDPCRMITPSGAIVYRDATHLTLRFAAEAAPRLGKLLTRYLE